MIFRGVPLPSMFFFLTSGDTRSFVWGGGIFCSETMFLCFVYRCFGFVVLVLVVYSIFSLFRILVVFCF